MRKADLGVSGKAMESERPRITELENAIGQGNTRYAPNQFGQVGTVEGTHYDP